jgi:hypothetical protein
VPGSKSSSIAPIQFSFIRSLRLPAGRPTIICGFTAVQV